MCEILWSDPQDQLGLKASKRGVAFEFGPDVTENFCKLNNIDYVIRSHEVKPEGYEVSHNGRCITVFSAPNYCDTIGNLGALITFTGGDLTPKFVTFKAVVRIFPYRISVWKILSDFSRFIFWVFFSSHIPTLQQCRTLLRCSECSADKLF